MCVSFTFGIFYVFSEKLFGEKLHVVFIISRFIKYMTFQCCLKVIYYVYLHSVKVIGVYLE